MGLVPHPDGSLPLCKRNECASDELEIVHENGNRPWKGRRIFNDVPYFHGVGWWFVYSSPQLLQLESP